MKSLNFGYQYDSFIAENIEKKDATLKILKNGYLLSSYLENLAYIEATNDTWQSAARIYFDLRRQGLTVRSPIDCCIAQIAIENDLLLLHNDKDFNTIQQVRPLIHLRWH